MIKQENKKQKNFLAKTKVIPSWMLQTDPFRLSAGPQMLPFLSVPAHCGLAAAAQTLHFAYQFPPIKDYDLL